MSKKLVILLLLSCQMFFGQNINWQWANSSNNTGPSNSYVTHTALDSNNNFYTLGNFTNEIGFEDLQIIDNNYTKFIAKFNSEGNVLWLKKLESTNDFEIIGLETDSNNNLIINGNIKLGTSFTGNINFNDEDNISFEATPNYGNYRHFSAKFNSNGILSWSDTDFGKSIVYSTDIDSNNNCYSFGEYTTSLVVEDTSLNSLSGDRDFYLLKKNNNNLIWSKKFDFYVNYLSKSQLKITDNNEIVIIGETSVENFHFQEYNHYMGHPDIKKLIIIKFDIDGNLISMNHILNPPLNDSYLHKYLINNHGFIYDYGTFTDNTLEINSTILNKVGQEDLYVGKFDSSGNLISANSIGLLNTGFTFDKLIEKNNELYILTDFYPTGTININNTNYTCNGEFTSLILKLDNNFNFIWTKSATGIGTTHGNFPNNLNISNNNEMFITGAYSCENIQFDNFNLLETNNTEVNLKIFIAKLIDKSNLSNDTNNNIYIYPNPVTTEINVLSSKKMFGKKYQIFNPLGKIITEKYIDNYSNTIDAKHLQSGIYFLKLEDYDAIKFIKN